MAKRNDKTGDVTVHVTGVEAKAAVGRLAAKGNTRLGEGKSRKYGYEALRGHEFNVAGQLMRKERIIDRRNNRYAETVVNEDTGEVVRHVEEPLSKHIGRHRT